MYVSFSENDILNYVAVLRYYFVRALVLNADNYPKWSWIINLIHRNTSYIMETKWRNTREFINKAKILFHYMIYHCFQRNYIVVVLAAHRSLWFNRRRLEVTVIEVTTIPMVQQFRLKTCIHYSCKATFRTWIRTRYRYRREIWVSVCQRNNRSQYTDTVQYSYFSY